MELVDIGTIAIHVALSQEPAEDYVEDNYQFLQLYAEIEEVCAKYGIVTDIA